MFAAHARMRPIPKTRMRPMRIIKVGHLLFGAVETPNIPVRLTWLLLPLPVYSRDLIWNPVGDQAEKFTDDPPRPVYDDILIAKLRPGQVRLVALLGFFYHL